MRLRTIVATRRLGLFAIPVILVSVVAWRLGPSKIVFDFEFTRPRVTLLFAEVCGLVLAVLGSVVLRSRLWQWERSAGPRAAIVAGIAALVGALGPVCVVAAGLIRTHDVSADWPLSNALVLGATVFLLSPLLSPQVSGAVVLLGYFVLGVVRQVWLDLTWLPLAFLSEPGLVAHKLVEPRPHWIAAAVLLVLAVAVQGKTRGQTAWVARVFDRDD